MFYKRLGAIVVLLVSMAMGAGYPELRHISTDWESINFEMSGTMLIEEELRTQEGTFTRLSFPGSAPSVEEGLPELPVFRRYVEIPFGAEPVIVIEDIEYREIPVDFTVYPRQPAYLKIEGYEPPFAFDSDFYISDSYTFQEAALAFHAGIARDYNLAIVEIHPVDFNPGTGMLRIISSLKLRIDLPGADQAETYRRKERLSTHYWREVMDCRVENPGFYRPLYVPPTDIGFLMIGSDGTADTLQKYARWKSRKGFKVEAVDESTAGTTTTAIKNFIQNRYDSGDPPPQFVVIVGDEDYVPTYSGSYSSGAPTDLNYAKLDGTDIYPDVFMGRWSITTYAQLDNLMDRNMEYERWELGGGTDWTLGACLPSTDDSYWHELAEATQQYIADTWFDPIGYTDIDLIQAAYGGTGSQVLAAINDGRMIVNYTGHGMTTYWDAPSVSQANVRNLTNANEYPFVISNACLTGKFDVDECFAETWIRQTDKAALAFMGASNNTMWNEDDAFARRMYDSTFVADYYFIGGMQHKGLWAVAQDYPSRRNYYFEIYHVFGDPSIALWFTPPEAMSVSHPATSTPAGGSFSVTVNDGAPLEDALVCVTNDDDIHMAQYTNASGVVNFTVPSASPGDTLYVTVTAYNHIPYFGFAIVNGNGPLLAYNTHSVDDPAGDGDDIPDCGESIDIYVNVTNTGTETAYSVYGNLSTTDPRATVIASSRPYGTIASGTSRTNSTPFTVTLAGDIEDQQEIEFDFAMSDADTTWDATFTISVRAPDLMVGSHYVAGGDGDSYAEPGERIELFVQGGNTSVEYADNVEGILSESDPYITIVDHTADYGDIDPASTEYPATAFVLDISGGCPTPYYANLNVTLNESRGHSTTESIILLIGNAGYGDDVEGGDLGYTESGPFISTRRACSGDHSWYFGRPDIFCYRDTFEYELITPSIMAPPNPTLNFSHYYEIEEGYDSAFVYISTDGGSSWDQMAGYNGRSAGWLLERIDLSGYVAEGSSFHLRFLLDTDPGLHCEGWFVDDIYVTSEENGYIGGRDVYPMAGTDLCDYTFRIGYESPSGITPSYARVYVNGTPYSMSLASGSASAGAIYETTQSFAAGGYAHYFEFNVGGDIVRFPTSGMLDGPFVNGSPYITYNIGYSNGGFTHSAATYDDWEWGVPSSGPSSASVPVGTRVWATELSGDYSDSADAHLITPEINLSGIIHPYIGWWHWYLFQPYNSYGYHDGGNIKISVDGGEPFIVYPQLGYDNELSQWNRLNSYQPAYAAENNGNFWQFECIDLSPWTGSTVQLYFDFGSSSVTTESGWYINNVYVMAAISAGLTDPPNAIPDELFLHSYPNPFNPEALIEVDVPRAGQAKLAIFDTKGRMIQILHSGNLTAGGHIFSWRPGQSQPNGIYFARLEMEGHTGFTKMVLLK